MSIIGIHAFTILCGLHCQPNSIFPTITDETGEEIQSKKPETPQYRLPPDPSKSKIISLVDSFFQLTQQIFIGVWVRGQGWPCQMSCVDLNVFESMSCWMIWPWPTFNSLAEVARFSMYPAFVVETAPHPHRSSTLLKSDSGLFCVMILLFMPNLPRMSLKSYIFVSSPQDQVPVIAPVVNARWLRLWLDERKERKDLFQIVCWHRAGV